MKVTVEGEFRSAESWEYTPEGSTKQYTGFTISILQDDTIAKLSVRTENAPSEFPAKGTDVRIEGVVQPGFDGKGFKVQVKTFEAVGAKPVASVASGAKALAG